MKLQRLWLCLAPFALCLFDISFTMYYQPRSYWAGNFSSAHEQSPEVRWAMMIHPFALFRGLLLWLGVVALLIHLSPYALAEVVAASVTIGHAIGASSWLSRVSQHSYQMRTVLAIAAGSLLMLSINMSRRACVKEQYAPVSRLRCLTIICILTVIAYAVLYPH